MSAPVRTVDDYLSRLRDVLPPGRADSVVAEVNSLIQDRLEDQGAEKPTVEDTQRALDALGPPEALASALLGGGTHVDYATQRAFTRMLAVVFAGHLLLAIVLTAIDAGAALVPGLIGALPRSSLWSTVCGIVGIFFVDVGFLGVTFLLLGRQRVPEILHRFRLEMPGTRRDAVLSLVLLALIAVIFNVSGFRDALFAVGRPETRAPILSPELLALLPVANVVLLLFALRHVLLLIAGGERVSGLAVDGFASLGGAVLAVLVMTRDQLVRIPVSTSLSQHQAEVFSDLLFRVMLVVCFVAALLLVTRFVKRVLRIRQLAS